MQLLLDSKYLVRLSNRVMETYAGVDSLLSEVPSFGFGVVYKAALGGPRPDSQEDVYEVCFIDQGGAEWWLKETFSEIGPGSVIVNRPGEWHGGKNAIIQPCQVFWVQVAFTEGQALHGLSMQETSFIKAAFVNMKHRFFTVSPEIRWHFERMLYEYRNRQTDSVLIARAVLHQILVTVIRDYANSVEKSLSIRSEPIQRALDWMEAHINEDYPVEAVAQVVAMSLGYFHTCFYQEVGFTPAEYRMRRRITLAKQLLRDKDLPITEIALQLGFSTSQYFSTVFRKIVGIAPKEYRELIFSSD